GGSNVNPDGSHMTDHADQGDRVDMRTDVPHETGPDMTQDQGPDQTQDMQGPDQIGPDITPPPDGGDGGGTRPRRQPARRRGPANVIDAEAPGTRTGNVLDLMGDTTNGSATQELAPPMGCSTADAVTNQIVYKYTTQSDAIVQVSADNPGTMSLDTVIFLLDA